MGTNAIEEKIKQLKRIFERTDKFDFLPIRIASPKEFYEAIGRAKKVNKHGACVDQLTIEEYAAMPFLFVTLDGMAGIAVTSDNNIVSVFNGGTHHGVLKTLMPVAIGVGGNKLDNYDVAKLSGLYELYGFNPISKTAFDETFAPSDWNYERDGHPDIVFWLHNGDAMSDVLLNFGKYDVSWDDVQEFLTYEDARAYRDSKT